MHFHIAHTELFLGAIRFAFNGVLVWQHSGIFLMDLKIWYKGFFFLMDSSSTDIVIHYSG